jgi:predicted metal-dependent peptidase
MQHIADPSVPTACTNGKEIRYNPSLVTALTVDQRVTLIAHEVLHPAQGHIFRREGRDPELWNLAADQEVDWILEEMNEQARAASKPIPFPWPPKEIGHPPPNPKYRGWAAERVYADMVQAGGQENDQDGSSSGSGTPSGSLEAGQPGDSSEPGSTQGSGWGDFEDAPGAQAQQELLESQWKNALAEAARVAKARGQLPSCVSKLVAALLDPPVSLEERLRAFYLDRVREDYSWQTPNRRYTQAGFYLPSLDSRALGKLVLAVDSSGSITDEEWAAFVCLVNHVTVDCLPTHTTVLVCDAQIQAIHDFDRGDYPEADAIRLEGGGGTDFRPVFDHVDQNDIQPACLVYFTDLDGTFPPEEPSYPVLWVTHSDKTTAPFGEVVKFP